mmetsp:Transcript_4240/g.7728  ORF Transcript_4240/g.7728 Transcript_4240/m.7728 type:complete len:198 (+) Transcript_4240:55-648(+)
MARLEIGEDALVCEESKIFSYGEHTVRIGARTIIHPLAKIEAVSGSIEIGEGNVIEEHAIIRNSDPDSQPLQIGNGNLIEVGSFIYCLQIGDYNVFKPRSCVDLGARISSGCLIGSTVHVQAGAQIADNSVLFRLGDDKESYGVHTPANNTSRNRHHVELYRSVLADPKKKSFVGKHHKVQRSKELPVSALEEQKEG